MAKAKSTLKSELLTFYAVDGSQSPVTLEIDIFSSGNNAVTHAVIKKVKIVDKQRGNISSTTIDSNEKLNDKLLTITTTVTKLENGANLADEVIRIKGGIHDKEYPLSVKLDNGTGKLIANIEFVEITNE